MLEDNPGALLEGSLGMLGVITELTLEVAAAKKVAVKQLQVGRGGQPWGAQRLYGLSSPAVTCAGDSAVSW